MKLDYLDYDEKSDSSKEAWKVDKFKEKAQKQEDELRRDRGKDLRVYSTAVRLSQQKAKPD